MLLHVADFMQSKVRNAPPHGPTAASPGVSPIPRTSPTDLLADLPWPTDLRKRGPEEFVSHIPRNMSRSPNEGVRTMFRRRNGCNASLGEAIAYLASACDGAIRRDGHGFSAEHVGLGHRLAQKRRWSRRDRRNARRIAVHHGRQLSSAGLQVKGISRSTAPRGSSTSKPQWTADPTRLHALRYWNGARWTQYVE